MTIEVLADPAPPEPPPPPPEPLRPVAGAERVEIIDIVRGIALFGILAANIRGFAGPAATYFLPHLFWPALHDRVAQAFVDTFIQGKFITIFAVLFGVGFGVQAERALARAGRFNWTWARRCFVLLLFGLAHGLLIWFGDILLVYALTGFLLLLFRRRQDKTIVIWAVILYCIPLVMMTGLFVAAQFGQGPPPMKPPTAAAIQQAGETFANGTWLEIQKARAHDVVAHNWGFFFFIVWHILSLFLFGLLLWRKRFFQPSPESLPRYRTLMLVALALGFAGNAAMVALKWVFNPPMMPTTPVSYAVVLLQFLAVPLLSLGYVCAVILLVHDPRWHARLKRFAYIGRTAFSNYLLQSVVGTLIFYSYGLGLLGRLGPALLLPLTVAIFALQVFLSRWWLARYRFGPMEWVWRRLTYSGPLPMRIPLLRTVAMILIVVCCAVVAEGSGKSMSAAKAIQRYEGVYKVRFDNSTVHSEDFVSENILEIVPYGKDKVYFRLHLEFFNAHLCELHGIATYEDGAFVFRDTYGEPDFCTLSIKPVDGEMTFDDADGSCKSHYCGARGGFYGVEFPISARRTIRYMKLLRASSEYAEAVEKFKEAKPSPKPDSP